MNATTLEMKNKVANLYVCMVWAVRLTNDASVLNQKVSDTDVIYLAQAGINVKGLSMEVALKEVKNWLETAKIA